MNNDLISRKYVQEHIPELDSYDNGCYVWLKREDVDNLINNAPAVESPEQITIKFDCDTEEDRQKFLSLIASGKVERPQGEWIEDYTAKNKKVVACNKCHCLNIMGKSNFCPNCGADMQKGGAE